MIRHIEHLLVAHDCVIMPGVGAVLAHRESARTDLAGGVLYAPARAFTFNPALRHNDGMLAASVARRECIPYEVAMARVEEASVQMREQLERQYALSLGRVGRIELVPDGGMRFVAGDVSGLSPDTMWLPQVDAAAFADNASASAPVTTHSVIRRISRRPRRLMLNVVKMAAAMALLVAVGITLITPVRIDNAQLASLGIGMTKTEEKPLVQMPGQASAPVVLVLERKPDAATPVDTAAYSAMRAAARAPKAFAKPTRSYCLVVASLDSEADARKFIARQDDSTLGVLNRDGRFRVYAAEASSQTELIELGRRIADRYPNSWVCRR